MSVDIEKGEGTVERGTVVRTGRVVAVCYSPELINGVGKRAHEAARITKWGIPGDRHYGETRMSHSRKERVPNDRPITVAGVEAVRDVCELLRIPEIPAGGLGENLLVEGLGDLSDLEPGDQLHITGTHGGPEVILLVRKQNEPCANLQIYHRLMVREMYGKRGVVCTVLKEGEVQVGDTVTLVRGERA
jgi:MOSC domain-containing protein YiiM